VSEGNTVKINEIWLKSTSFNQAVNEIDKILQEIEREMDVDRLSVEVKCLNQCGKAEKVEIDRSQHSFLSDLKIICAEISYYLNPKSMKNSCNPWAYSLL
jgi:hypothetical protein